MIFYRTSGAWGPGTGANLSAAQVDGNFYDVSTRVQYLELNPAAPVQITSFEAIGNKLYIGMSNGTVQGPLTLPTVRWRPRGLWAANTVYSVDDVVVGSDSSTYLVIFTHTSGTTFNANANDGAGHQFYSLLLQVPSLTLPAGGVNGTVLTKTSSNNYEMEWLQPTAPPGGDEGQVLMKFSSQDNDVTWDDIGLRNLYDVTYPKNLEEGDYLRWSNTANAWINQGRTGSVEFESSWAPVLGDEGMFMILYGSLSVTTTVTIPHDYTQPFAVGTELHIHQNGPGDVVIVGETIPGQGSVFIYRHASFANKLLGQYATATVKKTEFNEWRLFGLLAGAV